MKRLKVIMQEEAVLDLEDIWFYTLQTWSQEQADRYHELIFTEINFLSTKPKSVKNMNHLRLGYYSAKVKSHFIFYKFSATELEVIRILHESMDIPNTL